MIKLLTSAALTLAATLTASTMLMSHESAVSELSATPIPVPTVRPTATPTPTPTVSVTPTPAAKATPAPVQKPVARAAVKVAPVPAKLPVKPVVTPKLVPAPACDATAQGNIERDRVTLTADENRRYDNALREIAARYPNSDDKVQRDALAAANTQEALDHDETIHQIEAHVRTWKLSAGCGK